MNGPNQIHTEGNAIPSVHGTDLGDLLADLRGIHPGIDLILDGALLIAHDRHSIRMTQLLIAVLAGSPDALDAAAIPGLLAQRLTDPETNPCLRTLPLDAQKAATHQGWLTAHHLTDPEIRESTATAIAALDTH